MKNQKNSNIIIKFLKSIFKVFDKFIITPFSKLAYTIKDKFSFKSGVVDKLLNKPTVVLYLSLFIAIVVFIAIDKKVIGTNNTKAVVLKNQKVNVIYNEEAFVLKGYLIV